jgi:hypothetical protein
MEALASPRRFGIPHLARKLLTNWIALRSAHDAAMHSTRPGWDMGSGVA